MSDAISVLLLDDGELDSVVGVLEDLQVAFTRLRGGEIGERMAPPLDLLITTPRRAEAVRRGSPHGAKNGRPVRIIAVAEDSPAMRRMLRRKGFHLLVRLPTHDGIWRLLIQRAVYQGDERRRDTRVAVGAPVSLAEPHADSASGAVMLDISNRGCRLASKTPLEEGAHMSVTLPAATTGSKPLTLHGSLLRVSGGDEPGYVTAMVFDGDMDEAHRAALGALINHLSTGPGSLAMCAPSAPSLPACESAAIPGLTLDDETDPAIQVGQAVSLARDDDDDDDDDGDDRRAHRRTPFSQPVVASANNHARVLMGRDLSAGGMRIERVSDLAVGDEFRLALYGPLHPEPFLVDARVVRDDGDDGLALAFHGLDARAAESLEKLVACLPDLESLESDEAAGLGAVISQILDDRFRLG